jgi:hypothetical protein
MGLRDPVAAYTAANNAEAQMLAVMLHEAGIEAVAVDDVSFAAAGWLGLLPEIHKPQVWIERAAIELAKPILAEYEGQLAERRASERAKGRDAQPQIEVLCEECGKRSFFPASLNGSTENCPHCGAYVDVGEQPPIEGWNESGSDTSALEKD